MKQLIHNGILIPRKPDWKRLYITIQGRRVDLTPEQEEMAFAWVKKLGTEYTEDPVFAKNFVTDFCKALDLNPAVSVEHFDFLPVIREVEKERAYKMSLTREQKKRLAAKRKAVGDENKEKYGFALVDGVKVEVGNYTAEPSSIFMGRGSHPSRGRWKVGPDEPNIILNLSPDAPRPIGNWREIVWQPNSMWIAKWHDKLSGREKYVWLADSSPMKQQKDIEKFNKAIKLGMKIDDVRGYIALNLETEDDTKRKIATVCYLIDTLKLRVGDEKDPDEADTVGATTLRPEHIKLSEKNMVSFDFLGKDAVRWQKSLRLPPKVISNIQDFMASTASSIFEGVNSQSVSLFLDKVVPGVSAKVFRTYHATEVVNDFLNSFAISKQDQEYKKKHIATMANLEAAITCNHKRKPPKKWKESLAKKKERLKKLLEKGTPSANKKAEILKYKIKAYRETRDYNLGTSLKSYIDPRVYYRWGQKVQFDWKLYYPKTLQKKFSWVERKAI
jgi:DNA topoisomerase-1